MRLIDPEAREVRKQYDDQVDSVERAAGAKIAKIMLRHGGHEQPPDATFTLRLSYGAVKGYIEDGRGDVATKGDEGSLLHDHRRRLRTCAAKHEIQAALQLAAELDGRQEQSQSRHRRSTSLETADIIGGNSGSRRS